MDKKYNIGKATKISAKQYRILKQNYKFYQHTLYHHTCTRHEGVFTITIVIWNTASFKYSYMIDVHPTMPALRDREYQRILQLWDSKLD